MTKTIPAQRAKLPERGKTAVKAARPKARVFNTKWFAKAAKSFAKADRANIDDAELAAFKKLAKAYGKATEEGIANAVQQKELVEICHDRKEC